MLAYSIKLIVRRLVRNRLFSFINITGLALGLAATFLIFLFIRHEAGYEKHFLDSERVQRLSVIIRNGENVMHFGRVCPPMGPEYVKAYPEIESSVRFLHLNRPLGVAFDDKNFLEERIAYADSTVFNFFGQGLLRGNPATALARPETVVLRNDLAEKYFGNDDPIGKTVKINGRDCEVTGVMAPFTEPTHFRYSALLSFKGTRWEKNADNMWMSPIIFTYFKFKENADVEAVTKKIQDEYYDRFGEYFKQGDADFTFYFVPLHDLHLRDKAIDLHDDRGNVTYLYLFSAVAVFIILIASINFINLSTARAADRAKEVGIGKTLGASRKLMISINLLESIFVSLIALVLSIGMVELAIRFIPLLPGGGFSIPKPSSAVDWLLLLGFTVLVGFLAGLYPAFVLTACKPVSVLSGKLRTGLKGSGYRRILITVQFTMTILLLSGAFIVKQQLAYLQERDLGFVDDQLACMPLVSKSLRDGYKELKQQISQQPGVLNVAASGGSLGKESHALSMRGEDMPQDQSGLVWEFLGDQDYVPTHEMKLLSGRNYRTDETSRANTIILNEAAAKLFGWDDATGKKVYLDLDEKPGWEHELTVIGMVRDFNYRSLHTAVPPTAISLLGDDNRARYLNINFEPEKTREMIESVKKLWSEYAPDRPFELYFLDERFAEFYQQEERIQQLLSLFTLLAVLVTLTGLYGLTSFLTIARRREISIRRVLGATTSSLVQLLNKEMFAWIAVAAVIAVPAGFYAIQSWLKGYYYSISPSPLNFVYAILLLAALALGTSSIHTLSALRANLLKGLRTE